MSDTLSDVSSLAFSPTGDDDVLAESTAEARAQVPANVAQDEVQQQAGPSDPSLRTRLDGFFENLTKDLQNWIESHKIDESHKQALLDRFAQTQETLRNVKTTVFSAVGNMVKHVEDALGPSNKDAAEQKPRDFEELLEVFCKYEKEPESLERSRELKKVWKEYLLITRDNEELYQRTENFRHRLYATL